MEGYDANDPAVIKAWSDAEVAILEARAKLHPMAQVVWAAGDKIEDLFDTTGFVIVIISLSVIIPLLSNTFFGR